MEIFYLCILGHDWQVLIKFMEWWNVTHKYILPTGYTYECVVKFHACDALSFTCLTQVNFFYKKRNDSEGRKQRSYSMFHDRKGLRTLRSRIAANASCIVCILPT